jgi:hypothetical protein
MALSLHTNCKRTAESGAGVGRETHVVRAELAADEDEYVGDQEGQLFVDENQLLEAHVSAKQGGDVVL